MLIAILIALSWLALTWFAWTCRLPEEYDVVAVLAAEIERESEERRLAGDMPDNVVELRGVMR